MALTALLASAMAAQAAEAVGLSSCIHDQPLSMEKWKIWGAASREMMDAGENDPVLSRQYRNFHLLFLEVQVNVDKDPEQEYFECDEFLKEVAAHPLVLSFFRKHGLTDRETALLGLGVTIAGHKIFRPRPGRPLTSAYTSQEQIDFIMANKEALTRIAKQEEAEKAARLERGLAKARRSLVTGQ